MSRGRSTKFVRVLEKKILVVNMRYDNAMDFLMENKICSLFTMLWFSSDNSFRARYHVNYGACE